MTAYVKKVWVDHVDPVDQTNLNHLETQYDCANSEYTGKVVTNGDTHDHSGGDGAQIDHTTLSNIGTNAHSAIDTAISNSTSHISAASPHSGHAIGVASTTDNRVTRFDSTGGKQLQDSLMTIDDSGSPNIPSGQTYNINGSAHAHAGMGDVIGPATSTDHTISRFNGTDNKTIQGSLASIDDSGSVNIPTGQTYKINNASLTYTDVGAAASAKGVTNGDTHDHSGGDGAQIDHTTLSNIGTNAHSAIDTAITNSTSHISAASPHSGHAIGVASTTDNRVVRFDSTGGKQLQDSLMTIDDSGTPNIPSGQKYNINGSAHTHTPTEAGLSNVDNYKAVRDPGTSVDEQVLRWDGTGGDTLQACLLTVSDAGTANIPTGQTYNINASPHAHALATGGTDQTTVAKGDLLVGNAGATAWTKLTVGADNKVLKVVSGAPSWETVSGTGDVVGPSGATDQSIAIFDDATGKLLDDIAVPTSATQYLKCAGTGPVTYEWAAPTATVTNYPAPDYFCYKDGSNYITLDTHTGTTEETGTDLATVLQATINHLISDYGHGAIYFRPSDTFTFDMASEGTIAHTSGGVFLYSQGAKFDITSANCNTTIFDFGDDSTFRTMSAGTAFLTGMAGFQVIGLNTNTSTKLIVIRNECNTALVENISFNYVNNVVEIRGGCYSAVIRDVRGAYVRGTFIKFVTTATGGGPNDSIVDHCQNSNAADAAYNSSYGIYLDATTGSTNLDRINIQNCWLEKHNTGIYTTGTYLQYLEVSNNFIQSDQGTAPKCIDIESGKYHRVYDNQIGVGNGCYGVYIGIAGYQYEVNDNYFYISNGGIGISGSVSLNLNITGNTVQCDTSGAGVFLATAVHNYSNITGNRISGGSNGSQKYITLGAASYGCNIVGNVIRGGGNTTTGVAFTSGSTSHYNNITGNVFSNLQYGVDCAGGASGLGNSLIADNNFLATVTTPIYNSGTTNIIRDNMGDATTYTTKGPASATDNAIPRFDTDSYTLQNSVVTIADTTGTITIDGNAALSKPDGSTTKFARADGTWAAAGGTATYTSEPDYLIYKESTTYYAKNMRTGAVDSSSAAFSTVMQYCATALSSGGYIEMMPATYVVLTKVTFSPCTFINGQSCHFDITGMNDTVFEWNTDDEGHWTGSSTTSIGYRPTGISNCTVDGTRANTSTLFVKINQVGGGAQVTNVSTIKVHNVVQFNGGCYDAIVRDCRGAYMDGTFVKFYAEYFGSTNYCANQATVDHCEVSAVSTSCIGVNNTNAGGSAFSAEHVTISNCWFEGVHYGVTTSGNGTTVTDTVITLGTSGSSHIGIQGLTGSTQLKAIGCNFGLTLSDSVGFSAVSHYVVEGCSFWDNYGPAIQVTSTAYGKIIGNHFYPNSGASAYSIISGVLTRTTVSGNLFSCNGTTHTAINGSATGLHVSITGNTFTHMVTGITGTTDGINITGNHFYSCTTGVVCTNLTNYQIADNTFYSVSTPISGHTESSTKRTRDNLGDATYYSVIGPASATDNAIAKYNGTGGKTIQNSTWAIDVNGDLVPTTTNTYKIGSTSLYPNALYLNAGVYCNNDFTFYDFASTYQDVACKEIYCHGNIVPWMGIIPNSDLSGALGSASYRFTGLHLGTSPIVGAGAALKIRNNADSAYQAIDALSLSIGGNAVINSSGIVTNQVVSINFVIDGGGTTITTGKKGVVVVPFAMTVTGWDVIADQSGSIVVDVNRSTYSGFPTTSSIAGSELPTLSSVQKNQDLTLTTWTTSIAAGDILEFEVDSITTCQRVTVAIRGTRA